MKRRRHRPHQDVELNLAAMLDMAFQLLAFFILTFRPAPREAQIELTLPPPIPLTSPAIAGGGGNGGPIAVGETLPISLHGDEQGQLVRTLIGEREIFAGPLDPAKLARLEAELNQLFQDHGTPFDQVLLRVDPRLPYDVFIRVTETCARQTFADGKPVNRISFIELTPP